METLRKVLRGVDTFSLWQGYILAGFVLFLIGITLYDIVGRQFGQFTMWAFDIEWFTYAFIMMLALGYAVLKGQHVRIDLLTMRYSPRTQELILALSYAVVIIPLIVFIGVYSWKFAWAAMLINELTLIAWYAPIWPIKFFIVAGCILMLPQCFAEMTRHTYFVIKGEKL